MPALIADSPALTPPFAARRCAWTRPDLQSHGVLVIARSEMFLSPASTEPQSDRIRDDLDDSALAELLGPGVPLESIRGAKLDLLQNTIQLDLCSGRVELRFSTAKAADTCFTQLWRRLVPRLRLNTPQASRWNQARLPLTVLGAILAIVGGLALSISVVDDLPATGEAASVNVPGGPVAVPDAMHTLIGWMDWRVVCGLGGVAAAAAQVWLLRRISQPPTTLELICDRG